MAVSTLESRGFGPVALTVENVGLGGATIGGLSLLNGAIQAQTIHLDVPFTELLHGRLGRLSIKGATIASFDLPPGEDGPLVLPPVETIELKQLAVLLPSSSGPRRGEMDGTLHLVAAQSKVELTEGRIRSEGLPEIGVTGQGALDNGLARFSAEVHVLNAPVRLMLSGSHDLAENKGTAHLDLEPVRFDPNGFQPSALLPRLSEFVQAVSGTVSLRGDVAWTAAGVKPNLDVVAEEVSFTHGFLGVQRLNGVVKINGLSPVSTPPAQQVAAAVIQAGIPLTDVVLDFSIPDGQTLNVDGGRLNLAGGKVTVGKERIPLTGAPIGLTLLVKNVGLAEVATLTEMQGLSASGALSGRIPIALAAGDVHVQNAVLASTEPGILSYRPAGGTPSGMGVADLAWQALDDFHYTKLQARLNGRTSGKMDLSLALAGHNPQVYGGYPLEFNLTVEGRLAEVLSQGLRSYQIPDKIQKSMENALSKKPR
ncbi:MAG: hypothetical protein A2516_10170 [Alphaproteobacteria bacterium RIFOXYD12_FULL_60_8]|nr:MAG: hypothetical protein A2516_10170 [Alphaproteobacteria bacterium RIFOXYD12_FULL_60_8]